MKLKISKGTIYGKLKVLGEGKKIITPSNQTNRTLKCECECGQIKDVRVADLTRGKTKSCGCITKTINGEGHTLIGTLYKSIKSRCSSYNPERHLYFDRGIKMCDEWGNDFLKFKKFCLANGIKKGLQIDRINVDKGYEPYNCRFVTPKVNCNNKRNTLYVYYKGQKESLQLLLERLEYPNKYYTVRRRIIRGWDIEEAIFEKTKINYSSRKRKMNKKDVLAIRELHLKGERIKEISKKFNTSDANISLIVNRKTWKHI